jgi:polyhydroxyalkanoate synthesis regulator phasin
MAAPANPLRDVLERIAAELASAGNLRIEEARALVDQLAHRWRGDVVRAGERLGHAADGVFHEVGLVTREDHDELELRVAQLEHRLRLLEDAGVASAAATSSADRPLPRS